MRHRFIAFAVLPAVLALAACGSDNSSSGSSGNSGGYGGSAPTQGASTGGATLALSEHEFAIVPKDATVKAGKVTITIKNTGTTEHALSLEGAGPGGKDLETAPIQPGKSASLTATLKAGKVEMYCPIDGHKGMGMVGELTVS